MNLKIFETIMLVGTPWFMIYISLEDWFQSQSDKVKTFKFLTVWIHECDSDYILGAGVFGVALKLQFNKKSVQ